MIKDILKVAMAISCIILALATATSLNSLEDKAKREAKKEQKIKSGKIYENNLNNQPTVALLYYYILFHAKFLIQL